ncbi:hypothetical protein GCM10010329_12670 [Streptomyces spiroverticillatus]|uniref:Uncharacterized protein n=1 Tax=Streptomyces finlayi TaxID=67296 RepID=A0A918WXB8_9ACTN|nr:hypothetical protein GCM10010329_12670 [Streptomyces spiroverticillatus]GHC92459.1 hypothetical protein GCM10010334_28430 [Streptomyces finlayi]
MTVGSVSEPSGKDAEVDMTMTVMVTAGADLPGEGKKEVNPPCCELTHKAPDKPPTLPSNE